MRNWGREGGSGAGRVDHGRGRRGRNGSTVKEGRSREQEGGSARRTRRRGRERVDLSHKYIMNMQTVFLQTFKGNILEKRKYY